MVAVNLSETPRTIQLDVPVKFAGILVSAIVLTLSWLDRTTAASGISDKISLKTRLTIVLELLLGRLDRAPLAATTEVDRMGIAASP
ncbi:MAG: hypothetical protein WCJ64_27320 [Rhodospirillaceae bacterium]